MQLGHRLPRLTGDRQYSEPAGRVWAWVRGAGLLNMTSYQVRAACSSTAALQQVATAGV